MSKLPIPTRLDKKRGKEICGLAQDTPVNINNLSDDVVWKILPFVDPRDLESARLVSGSITLNFFIFSLSLCSSLLSSLGDSWKSDSYFRFLLDGTISYQNIVFYTRLNLSLWLRGAGQVDF